MRRFDYLLWAFVAPLLLNAVILLQPWWDPRLIYVDPLIAAQMTEECCGRYFGMASNVGALYWAVAAACCGLAAMVLWRGPAPSGKVWFLVAAAMFTALLGIDDLFLLHEEILPRFGVPEAVTFGTYGILAAFYLLQNWRQIRDEEPVLFVLALGFLALSVGVDSFNRSDAAFGPLLEDAAKLMGIAGWSTYHVRRAYGALRTVAT